MKAPQPRMLQRATLAAGFALACAGAPPTEQSPLSRAHSSLAAGDTAAAVHILEKAGAHHGDDAQAARLLGHLYRDRGTIQGRLLSQHTLEKACARHPGDLELDVELATTYFEQGFYPDAVRALRDILAREPERCDARKLLGLYHYRNWKRMNEYSDDLADARRQLREALECAPDDADAALRYLIAGYALGDSIERECDRFIERFPDLPEFRLMRGTVAFDRKRYEACAADYAGALERMDAATLAVYTSSLTHVLGAIDDERYQRSTEPARDDFRRGLWLIADPDPTTETNPRLLEHVYRLFVADCLYSNEPTERHGWATDRGEAFVRFGRPMEIEYVMGEGWINGKVETWSFVTEGIFHQLVFVDEYLNGNPRIPYRADITLHFMRHSPASSTLEPDAAEIPAFADAIAFRDDEMTSTVYVAMAVDASALRAVVDVSRLDRFIARAAYFDEAWTREGGFSDSVAVGDVIEAETTPGRAAFEWVRELRMPSDRYHIATAFEDAQGLTRAVGRRDVDALRFAHDGLQLSDVLLYRAEAPRPGEAAVERGGARMRPNVERQYGADDRLRAYVEIYGLTLATDGAERTSSYDLRFAIFPSRGKDDPAWVDFGRRAIEWAGFGERDDAAIAQTFRREGRAYNEQESIAIDIDALGDGRYELVVEVKDRRSGESALVHAPFWKHAGRIARGRR